MIVSVRIDPMPDEPIWGHFYRFARVNGFRSWQMLETAFPARKATGGGRHVRLRSAIVEYLAGGPAKRTLYEYFQAHSACPQMLTVGHWLFSWRYMLNRWAFHNADFFRAPLVVRSCSACAKADIADKGFTWFRRIHQIPGVDWCLQHSQPLHAQPAPMNFLTHARWEEIKISVRQAAQGELPSFVHRYIFAITWLAQSSGDSVRVDQLTTALDSVERERGRLPLQSLRLPGSPVSIATRDWYRSNFEDPVPSPSWALSIANHFTAPRLALRAAAATWTLEELESLTTDACSGFGKANCQSIKDLKGVLDLDDDFPEVERERLAHSRWPGAWVTDSARVGLGQ